MSDHPVLSLKSEKNVEEEGLSTDFARKVEEILQKQEVRRLKLRAELKKIDELEEQANILKMLEQHDFELDALEKRLLQLLIDKLEQK